MKSILIDVKTKQVSEVEIDKSKNELKQMYYLVGCRTVEALQINEKGDTIYFDEEGTFREYIHDDMFSIWIEGQEWPLIGNGLIMGCNLNTGNSISCKVTLSQVAEMIKFH